MSKSNIRRRGTCSNCGRIDARHDYCDNCGHSDPLHDATVREIDRLHAEIERLQAELSALPELLAALDLLFSAEARFDGRPPETIQRWHSAQDRLASAIKRVRTARTAFQPPNAGGEPPATERSG